MMAWWAEILLTENVKYVCVYTIYILYIAYRVFCILKTEKSIKWIYSDCILKTNIDLKPQFFLQCLDI